MYQHDTPDKHLFAHDKRAYSHGCMRVENPLKYGEVLLGLALPNEHYTAERLQKMFGGSEININFPTGIPVHLTYQTAFVDDDGKLQIRDDVYGRDAAPAGDPQGLRAQDGRHRHRPAEGLVVGAGEDAARHLRQRRWRQRLRSFFDRLFGGSPQPAPKPRARVGANEQRRVTPR